MINMLKEQTVSEADQNEQVSHRTINGTIAEIKSFFTDGKTFGFFTKDEFLKYIDTLKTKRVYYISVKCSNSLPKATQLII
ncbi:hypothetical protein [Pedobacter sp. NJ-S-72]